MHGSLEHLYRIVGIVPLRFKNPHYGSEINSFVLDADKEFLEFEHDIAKHVTARDVDSAILLFRQWIEARAAEGALYVSTPAGMPHSHKFEVNGKIDVTDCKRIEQGVVVRVGT